MSELTTATDAEILEWRSRAAFGAGVDRCHLQIVERALNATARLSMCVTRDHAQRLRGGEDPRRKGAVFVQELEGAPGLQQ
ncbi:hypothetical protein ACU4GD_45685 [Cupriavidus basilensis]